jgi:transcriptional regulator of acetoin/glycerol metabolism
MAHDYPGNVRELQNIIEHAFVMCREDIILSEHLPPEFIPKIHNSAWTPSGELRLKDLEARYIWEALRRNNWNRLATARSLGMSKSTFFRKVKTLQMQLPEKDGRNFMT